MYTNKLVRRSALSLITFPMLAFLFSMMSVSTQARSQWSCAAPALTTNQIRDLVKQARERYSNLPREPASYEWYILQVGCHYVYSEEVNSEFITKELEFTFNPSGLLVDFEISSGH